MQGACEGMSSRVLRLISRAAEEPDFLLGPPVGLHWRGAVLLRRRPNDMLGENPENLNVDFT